VPAAGDEGQVACPAGPRFWEGAGLASNRPGRRLLRQELRMASPTHATLATIRMDLSREAEQREGLQREPTPRRVGPGGCAHSRGGRQRVEAPERQRARCRRLVARARRTNQRGYGPPARPPLGRRRCTCQLRWGRVDAAADRPRLPRSAGFVPDAHGGANQPVARQAPAPSPARIRRSSSYSSPGS
jgi:hypothetical protein